MTIDHRDAVVHRWDADDQHWQESVAVWFFDADTGAGGFFRVGIHPNQHYGRYNVFAFVEGRQRFRRVRGRADATPISPVPGDALTVAGCSTGIDTFAWDEPECSAELTMVEYFYAEHSFSGHGDDALDGLIYGGHVESSGRLAGTLRVGVDACEISALVHRDRSWGPRDMAAVMTNRMITGTMGPELSFALNSIGLVGNHTANVGYVVRNGVAEDVHDYVILPTIHLDGYSVEAGTALVRLSSGETLDITCETVEGFLNPHDDYLCSEHISTARCGDLVGFCDNELTNNPRLGSAWPPNPLYVTDVDGLSPCPIRPYRTWRNHS
jgi:hypothetical protein